MPREVDGGGAGHDHVVVVGAPFDQQFAAVQHEHGRTFGEVAPGGGHQGRAGAGAAGLGQARAALPDPQANAVAALDLGEADIDVLWEQRVALDGGELLIEWRADDHVIMTGPAAVDFAGELP